MADERSLYRLNGVAHVASSINEEFTVNFTWFHERFRVLPQDATEDIVRIYAQAYIMMLLSTQLFGDKSGNRVHIRWLSFVARLDEMGSYGWASTALACLYRLIKE
ncbi:hypothetical protein Ahy_B03g068099 [Arachis hypogaea]|uniref:Aminotransferase-like plant mobile domain-containing protein n=1 Tax=Arachis hypogaea TaxID=3818 RepID=A0A445A8S5_ARAHY|nr:hypothetical protein Ahy_B03g068099 [Arachis hypogaea]